MLFALTLSVLAPQNVHIVDDLSGPPTEFTSIQAAIDAAQDGDTVLVRPGNYDFFVVDGKGVSIVGLEEGGERAHLLAFDTTWVRNLAAGQEVTIRGFEAETLLRVENNDGPVLLEDLHGDWNLIAAASDHVLLVRCTLHPEFGSGISASASTLHGWELDVRGCDNGCNGIALAQSFLFLSGSVVKGGGGSFGSSGSIFNPFCGDGGDGGDGLSLQSSTCYAIACQFQGGGGGPPGTPKIGPPCSPGQSGVGVAGPGFVPLAGVSHELEISSPGFEADTVHVRVGGASGEFAYALFSTALDPLWLPPYGTLAVSPFSKLLFLGVLGPSGVLEADVNVGELGPGVEAVRLVLQGIFVHPTGPDYFGSATSVELLDRDIFLVDCNGNGIDDAQDLASGTSVDLNGNGQPDECDVTLIVPDFYPTIQAAVDAALHKNIVLVRSGTYSGPGFHGVQVIGKDIAIVSEMGSAATVIDLATATLYGIQFGGFEPLESVPDTARIQGFTFRNHDGVQSPVMVFASGAAIVDCVFEDNEGGGGWSGAISSFESPYAPQPARTLRIERCVFRRNVHETFGMGWGGAVQARSGDQGSFHVVIENCLFEENEGKVGGALWTGEVDLDIRNSQFHANRASSNASALFWEIDYDYQPTPARHVSIEGSTFHGNVCTAPDSPAVILSGDGVPSASVSARNSIFFGNTNPGALQHQVGTWNNVAANAAWCTLQHGPTGWTGPVTFGPGLSAANPLFVNPAGGDLHLGPGSPCRDAGDPAFVALPGELDLDLEPRVFGPAVDQGADEDQP